MSDGSTLLSVKERRIWRWSLLRQMRLFSQTESGQFLRPSDTPRNWDETSEVPWHLPFPVSVHLEFTHLVSSSGRMPFPYEYEVELYMPIQIEQPSQLTQYLLRVSLTRFRRARIARSHWDFVLPEGAADDLPSHSKLKQSMNVDHTFNAIWLADGVQTKRWFS